ncbi:MAG: hypothetical protein IT375_36160 [Polyangiaceae bacterium]|nr:hypothetical protein [Polyangiaceae bacterium]
MRRLASKVVSSAALLLCARCGGQTMSDRDLPSGGAAGFVDATVGQGGGPPTPDAGLDPADAAALVIDAGAATFSLSEAQCGALQDGCAGADAGSLTALLQQGLVLPCPIGGNAGCSGFTLSFDEHGCVALAKPAKSHAGWTQPFLDCFFSRLTTTRWPCAASKGETFVHTGGSCTK